MHMELQGQPLNLDLTRLPGAHQHIALVPQWDFLELLASAAEAEPSFRLLRSTEVTGVIRDGDRIVGVTYRDQTGETKQMRAELTVACDGRSSTVRSAVGLKPRTSAHRWTFGGSGCLAGPTIRADLPAPSTPGTGPS